VCGMWHVGAAGWGVEISRSGPSLPGAGHPARSVFLLSLGGVAAHRRGGARLPRMQLLVHPPTPCSAGGGVKHCIVYARVHPHFCSPARSFLPVCKSQLEVHASDSSSAPLRAICDQRWRVGRVRGWGHHLLVKRYRRGVRHIKVEVHGCVLKIACPFVRLARHRLALALGGA
jgi:hypothetical protein